MGKMENQKLAVQIAIQTQLTRGMDCPPVHILGGVGIGKTAYLESVASQGGNTFVPLSASQIVPEFISGIPYADLASGVAKLLPADLLLPVMECKAGTGIVLLDEMADASPMVQAAFHRLLTHGEAGSQKLSPRTAFVAASNPPDVSTTGGSTSQAITTRCITIVWNNDDNTAYTSALKRYGVSGWEKDEVIELPKGWQDGIPQMATLIGSFLDHRPSERVRVPDANEMLGGILLGESAPAPNHRTWLFVVNLLTAAKSLNVPREVEKILVDGCVGEDAANALFQYITANQLPDPEHLLNGKRPALPNRSDLLAAVMDSVVTAVIGNNTVARFNAAFDVAEWLMEETGGTAESICALAVPPLCRNLPAGLGKPPAKMTMFMDILQKSGMLERRQ